MRLCGHVLSEPRLMFQRRPTREQARARRAYSARPNRSAEDVVVLAVVVSKLELIHVQRQILLGDLVERTDDPALDDGPETFDGVCMDCTVNVLSEAVTHEVMRVTAMQARIARVFVGRDKADLWATAMRTKASRVS